MKIKILRTSLIFFAVAGIAAGILSCQSPMEPAASDEFDNLAEIQVTAAYTALDSQKVRFFSDTLPAGSPLAWQAGVAFKISFVPKLKSAYLALPALYNLYRVAEGGENRVLISRTLGSFSGISKSPLTYLTGAGKIDTVVNNGNNFVYDLINPNAMEKIKYGVSVSVNLQGGVAGTDFQGGSEGLVTFSVPIGGGLPNRLSINQNALETAVPWVQLEGAFNTAGLKGVVLYRYSEILALDSAQIIGYIAHKSDSAGPSVFFPFAQLRAVYYYDSLSLRADSTVTLLSTNPLSKGYFEFGKLGRVDSVSRADFGTYFDQFTENPLTQTATFQKGDTLVGGLGRKWVAITGIWDSTYAGNRWGSIADTIRIAQYFGKLGLAPSAETRKVDFKGSRRICLTEEQIPYFFDTFRDTTFSSDVQVWVATRSLSADFLDPAAKITGSKVTASFYPPRKDTDSVMVDCVFETPPQTVLLDAFGVANGSIEIPATFRVSPLARKTGKAISMDLDGVQRQGSVDIDLSRSVKPGSILGYTEGRLNQTGNDTVYTFSSQSTNIQDLLSARPAPGWYEASPATAGQPFLVNQIVRVENLPPYNWQSQKTVFQNPFRSLPVNVPSVKRGYKEFAIVVYAKGKYFNEPRVFISKASSDLPFVWDKIPPQIVWASDYNPASSSKYAPMAYRDPLNLANNRVTNLSIVGNIFSVYLAATDGQKKRNPAVGVRDAGHGKISSVTLCFHREGAFTGEPVTGFRTYTDGTPVKKYPLDQYQLDRQAQIIYGDGNDSLSFGIPEAAFTGIDARNWLVGNWDMWVETKDDLGNEGIASLAVQKFNFAVGDYFIRTIEIK